MQRNLDLVRDILAEIAEHPSADAPRQIKIEGHSDEQIAYHCALMIDAGLLEGAIVTDRGVPTEASISRLTWIGHEFLDAAREPSRWQEAKTSIAKIGGASFSVLFDVLKELAKKKLGL